MDNPQEAEDQAVLEEKSFGRFDQLSNTAQSQKLEPRFQAWDQVQAYREDCDKWFAAVVAKRNGNGTYAIVWAPPNEKWPAVRNMRDSDLRPAARKVGLNRKHVGKSFEYAPRPRCGPRWQVNRYEQETPGPGAYNTHTHRSISADTSKFSFMKCKLGSAWEPQGYTRRSKHQQTPGPGCYCPRSQDVGTSPQFSFNKMRDDFRCFDTPGPGCYKPKWTDARTNPNGLSYSMRTVLKF